MKVERREKEYSKEEICMAISISLSLSLFLFLSAARRYDEEWRNWGIMNPLSLLLARATHTGRLL
jgi:hypothetical protein